MTNHPVDPVEAFHLADREYRETERQLKIDRQGRRVELTFRNPADAHEYIETIKRNGGVITNVIYDHPTSPTITILPVAVETIEEADF